MERRLILFEWNAQAAEARAEQIRTAGWTVEVESEDGARGVRRVLDHPPTLVAFDLAYSPAHSLRSAAAIRKYRDVRHLPLLFIGGAPALVKRAQEEFRGAAFVAPEMLLKRLDGFDL